jgi:heme a synthase
MKSQARLESFARILLFYGLIVILWGAWVRISHSGDGCGDTWPLCHGQLIPQAERGKTWVEYGHRLMSGSFGLLIIWLYFQARKNFPKSSKVRLFAFFSLLFTITEALLGAKLVLFKLVGSNGSPYRAFIMTLHLVNSLLLIGSLALTWDFLRFPNLKRRLNSPWESAYLRARLSVKRLTASGLLIFLIIGCTGAIASLASTLFPSESLLAGIAEDFNPDSHFLLRLRLLHPLMGIFLGGSLALAAWLASENISDSNLMLKKRSRVLAIATGGGVVFGILTLLLLAPVWMKLAHLTIAYTVWISLLMWLRELLFHENSVL